MFSRRPRQPASERKKKTKKPSSSEEETDSTSETVSSLFEDHFHLVSRYLGWVRWNRSVS